MENVTMRLLFWTLVFLSHFCLNSLGSVREGFNGVYFPGRLRVRRDEPIPGTARKVYEVDKEDEKDPENIDNKFHETLRRQKRSKDPDMSPKITTFNFNDSHYTAIVHWVGDYSPLVIIVTKNGYGSDRNTTKLYISRDYGGNYTDRTNDLLLSNGRPAQINTFYPSPVTKDHFIFTDIVNKVLFVSRDGCKTFRRVSIFFCPNSIVFNPYRQYVVLAYDTSQPSKKLYYSSYYGATSWRLKSSDVKSFFWGVSGYDSTSQLYIERRRVYSNTSVVLRSSYYSWYYATIITDVIDFELKDNFMFATKQANDSSGDLNLMVSNNRGPFRKAMFPLGLAEKKYYIADASEKQVFVAVNHQANYSHLYISDTSGIYYTLSLERILFFSSNVDTWLRRYIDHEFVDLYRVGSLNGVYIATQLSSGQPGHRTLKSMITFDKGGNWQLIPAPEFDADRNKINCNLPDCSLHISMEFGSHYPNTHFPMPLAKKSAPGLIVATGNFGNVMSVRGDIYLSSDAGLTWYQIHKGLHHYAFGDHGGIIVAVPLGQYTNYILYSWNEGETWFTHQFGTERIIVYGLLTEPGEHNATFTLFGSNRGRHSWLVVQLDMKKVLGSPCTKDDYKTWSPSDGMNNTQTCILGSHEVFERRISHAHCYNGYDYDRPISQESCPCDAEDFECDFGFKKYFFGYCARDPKSPYDPWKIPDYCPEGTYFNRTKGYRKVAGDVCSGGIEDQLAPQKVSCPITTSTQFLLYAKRTSIHKINLRDNSDEQIPLVGLRNAIAVEFDYRDNCLYWADITVDMIQRTYLNGSANVGRVAGDDLQQVESLALDWIAGTLYWVDAGTKKIEVARKDGFFRHTVITEQLQRPRAMVLDPIGGSMFWTDWGTGAKIERANMDGNNRTAIISTGLRWPNGITIDRVAKKLFWTDAGTDVIETSNFDGSGRKVVIAVNLPHPYAIAEISIYLFWDDWTTKSIMRGSKFNEGHRAVIKSNIYGIMDLKIFTNTSQQGVNPCLRRPPRCTHLCHAIPISPWYNCSCPSDMLTVVDSSYKLVTCECQTGEILLANGSCVVNPNNSTCNPAFDFTCNNGRCIPKHWRCDHDNDCGDNSDETNCPHSTCASDKFTCTNGRCIPQSWKCDHDNDCGDMSDEMHCNATTCSPDHFKCNNNRCIPKRWVCDHDDDCRDGSDEQNCTPAPTSPPASNCSNTSFPCRNGRCIPRRWKCDGENDCGDGSDETGCPPHSCHSYQFTCTSGLCISRSWVCDGDNDCADWSDEQNCNATTSPPHTTPTHHQGCLPGQFLCRNHYCVSNSDVCDGTNDCGDNSDELGCPTHTTPASCHSNQFTCVYTRQCIPMRQRCDGIKNCIDGTDENGCATTPPISCKLNYVHCDNDNSKPCIYRGFICDGLINCVSGWDERNCPTTAPPQSCPIGQFPCGNKQCVPNKSVCNGKKDCSNGADEVGCTPTTKPPTCPSGTLKCKQNYFQCVAFSSICDGVRDCIFSGSDEANCSAPVQDLKVSSVGLTSVTLTWSNPSSFSDLISGYIISYKKITDEGGEIAENIQINKKTTAATVYGLSYCTDYDFTVKISLKSGYISKESDPVKARTKRPDKPSAAPQNVTATVDSSSSIRVSWSPPKDICGKISFYYVYYNRFKVQSDRTVHILSGLHQNIVYKIKVTAVIDSSEESQASSTITIKITDNIPCPNDGFLCKKEQKCISLFNRCDGHRDCNDGSDEDYDICSCLSKEFECEYEECIDRRNVCDGSVDCVNGKDEDKGMCEDLQTTQVRNINYTLTGLTVTLSWTKPTTLKYPDKPRYSVYYMQNSLDNPALFVYSGKYLTVDVNDLCPGYTHEFAIQSEWDTFSGRKTYVSVKTPGNTPARPMLRATLADTTVSLYWSPAYKKEKVDYYIYVGSGHYINFETYLTQTNKLNYEVHLSPEDFGIKGFVVSVGRYGPISDITQVIIPEPQPKPAARTTEKKKNVLPWAIPVALVGLGLLVALVFFVWKTQRLQRSMYALLSRNDDDHTMGVAFNADEDMPVIQGFSDDEPLVTA